MKISSMIKFQQTLRQMITYVDEIIIETNTDISKIINSTNTTSPSSKIDSQWLCQSYLPIHIVSCTER